MKPWSRGYSEYKTLYIQKILEKNGMDFNALPDRYGFRLDERVVEYPWFLSRLPRESGTLLDAGSVLNFRYVLSHPSLKAKKVFISTLAPERSCFWKQGISYVYEDLRNSCFRDEYFDWIASLSTIEHIGLDNTLLYTADASKKENQSASCLGAVKEFHRMLKPGGKLYLSVPFGKAVNRDWFQVFDGAMVDEIIRAFGPSQAEEFYFKYEADGWKTSSREAAKDATCFDINVQKNYDADFAAFSRAVVCLELTK
jgi:SAM-dependent methyltransferase